jgi:hypothetical protein
VRHATLSPIRKTKSVKGGAMNRKKKQYGEHRFATFVMAITKSVLFAAEKTLPLFTAAPGRWQPRQKWRGCFHITPRIGPVIMFAGLMAGEERFRKCG